MKITDVEAIVLRSRSGVVEDIADGSQDALIIKVTTDEGIVGYGEVDSSPSVVRAVVDAPTSHNICRGLRSLLLGADPMSPDVLWQKMFEGSLYYGRRGVAVHALSGIEIALWDICGKALGVPAHRLLGGPWRDRIKAYASTLMPETPAEAAETVAQQLEAGFRAVKLGYGPLGRDLERDVELVAAAREAAGPSTDLMIDVGLGWQRTRQAIDGARAMSTFRPYWIEEPFPPDDLASYALLCEAVDVPIAAGEQESHVNDFARLLDTGVAVLQPDVTRAGGMRKCLQVAEMARSRGRQCVLHAWSTGIIKAASLQVLAAMPGAEYFEYCVQATELNKDLVSHSFPLHDGYVLIPDGPGLGVEIDEALLDQLRVT
jgi:L-rhamnonate dehydratase